MKRSLILLLILSLFVPVLFLGCSGDDGSQGPAGQSIQGPEGPAGPQIVQPESCVVCHNGHTARNGITHQEAYDDLYQDNVIRVTNLAYSFNPVDNTDIVTFNMTKAGLPFDCTQLDSFQDPPAGTGSSIGIYFVAYDNTTRSFNPPAPLTSDLRIGQSFSVSGSGTVTPSTLAYNAGTNLCTSTKAASTAGNLSLRNGLIVVYGRNDSLSGEEESPELRFTRVVQTRFPFAATLNIGSVDYASAANVAGCEKCHTVPFLKHGYIYGLPGGVAGTDFYTCKACHDDNGNGGHLEWQLAVNDPTLWVTYLEDGSGALTAAQKAPYAYKTRLMNDVHMSHAMEFPYPQSMSNCVVCHEGKLGTLLVDANFVAETCKSCHPETGAPAGTEPEAFFAKKAPAMRTLWNRVGFLSFHVTLGGLDSNCNSAGCHVAGGSGKQFNVLHTGYDKSIYASPGQKYSAVFQATIDNASFSGNVLTFGFSATENPDLPGLAVTDITPTVLVGLYGWDSKDYIVGPHERNFDDNGDGDVDRDDQRNLEYVVGRNHPRFTTVSSGGGKWTVEANLSAWDNLIVNGTVRRVEIAVLATLKNPAINTSDNVVALNAPSRTFNLGTNKFESNYYQDNNAIVNVATGCNNCHDALADTFHSPDRGGNIVVCRLCHITKDPGSHLEMQSRSIDSYAHSIHTFQAFDIGDVNFNDPVQALHYKEHTRFAFPTLGRTNCVACHTAKQLANGRIAYNVPDQAKSMPGLLSASDNHALLVKNGFDRNIGDIPEYVTGPATRACGGCHRGNFINEDDAAGLGAFNAHTRTNGYLIENDDDDTVRDRVINEIMMMFYP